MFEVLSMFSKMIRLGCAPDVVTYSIIIDGLCKIGNAAAALELYQHMVHGKVGATKESSKPKTVSCALNDGRAVEWPTCDTKEQDSEIALDVVFYNCLIDGLCRSEMEEDANSLLAEMIARSVHPSVVTFNITMNSLCNKGKVEQAIEVLETMMTQRGGLPDLFTCNCLIKGLCLAGRVGDARGVFSWRESRGLECDVVTYNTLIDGYCRAGRLEEAHDLFIDMDTNGFPPDIITFNTLIKWYCNLGMLEKANDLLLEMEAKGCSPDVITFNKLLEGFACQKESTKVKELLGKCST